MKKSSTVQNIPGTKPNKIEKKANAEIRLKENKDKLIGSYTIKIITESKIRFNDEFGKLIITDTGMTMTSEIPSIERVSGSFSVPFTNKVDDNTLYGNLSKGFPIYDTFVISVNSSGSAAGITLASDSGMFDTTTIVIQEKL